MPAGDHAEYRSRARSLVRLICSVPVALPGLRDRQLAAPGHHRLVRTASAYTRLRGVFGEAQLELGNARVGRDDWRLDIPMWLGYYEHEFGDLGLTVRATAGQFGGVEYRLSPTLAVMGEYDTDRFNYGLCAAPDRSWRIDLTLTDSRAIGAAISYLGIFP